MEDIGEKMGGDSIHRKKGRESKQSKTPDIRNETTEKGGGKGLGY